MLTKHKGEDDVVQALSHRKNSSERKKNLTKLRLKGDYHHNMKILEIGGGELIVVRRPAEDETCTIDDFLPCEFCLGFMKRWDLWKHQLACEFNPKPENEHGNGKQQVQLKAKLMLAPTITGSEDEQLNRIISVMKHDPITKIVQKDPLIKAFGSFMIEKSGLKDGQFISQKMRELGRLVEGLMSVEENKNVQLSEFIKPEKFDTVVTAVRNIAGFNSENNKLEVSIPSLALKVGYSIQKCASILSGQALRTKDDLALKDSKNFQKLMRSEWECRVSHHSLATLHERKFNKVDVPPLAEDVTHLKNFVEQKIEEESKNLKASPTLKSWTSLAKLLLVRIVMLNKRRAGEASKLLLTSYNSRPDWTQSASKEILDSLSPWERQLSAR